MLLKQTKIVASISDRRCDVDFIKQLFEAGMNVVRMNTAHASREGFEALIANVRSVSNRIAILMDTKGPNSRKSAGFPWMCRIRAVRLMRIHRKSFRNCVIGRENVLSRTKRSVNVCLYGSTRRRRRCAIAGRLRSWPWNWQIEF